MLTQNPRVNIVAGKELYNSLSAIAKVEKVSLSAIAKELILEALEKREDKFLSEIANFRDTGKNKLLSHKAIWNE